MIMIVMVLMMMTIHMMVKMCGHDDFDVDGADDDHDSDDGDYVDDGYDYYDDDEDDSYEAPDFHHLN